LRLLVLGGTLFLGRHVVESALDRGHEVTLFTRGRTNPDLFPDAEHVVGDRDGGLSPLAGREWDAVIDPSGYLPRVVAASVELLAAATGHYTFVSSISAYRDFGQVGFDEDYPTGDLPDDHGENVDRFYGPLKAACERVATATFPDRSLVVRAGLIVGRYDWTNRFGWWMRRVADGGDVVLPDANPWPIQVVHGRDLADWMLKQAESGGTGTFNATGPEEPLAMDDVLAAARNVSGSDARFVKVDEDFLLERGVEPFDDLPLWLALPKNPDFAGFFRADIGRAVTAGLRFRPLADTVAEALAWERERAGAPEKDYGPQALARGLDPAREAELLRDWRAAG
jgi:2'-hydroxyisoflavone reductase